MSAPTGTFSVLEKVRDVMFTSPWTEGSPDYYEPTHVNYALLSSAPTITKAEMALPRPMMLPSTPKTIAIIFMCFLYFLRQNGEQIGRRLQCCLGVSRAIQWDQCP